MHSYIIHILDQLLFFQYKKTEMFDVLCNILVNSSTVHSTVGYSTVQHSTILHSIA